MKLRNLIKEFIPGTLLDLRKGPGDVWQLPLSGAWAAIGPLGYRISYSEGADGEKNANMFAKTGKDMEGNSEQEIVIADNPVTESTSDEKLYKDLLKKRAYAVRKGQTTLVNSLHKEIEKLVRTMRKNKSVNKLDAYTLHMLADTPGTGTAEEFLKNNPNIDLDLLAVAIQQGTINKYELRDIVKGVAHKYDVKKFMKQFIKESWVRGLDRYKVTLENGDAIDVKVKEGQGLQAVEELLNKEGLKYRKVMKKASRATLSVNEDHDTFKSDIKASKSLTAEIHKVLLAYHNEPVPEKKKKLLAQLKKLKAKDLALKKKIMPEKFNKRSDLGTIMSEIKSDRKS